MSLLQEMETHGLADCEFNRKIQVIEKSLYWQRHVFNTTKDAKQRERAKNAIIKLEKELKKL
jgi:hypothetical protein